MRRENTFLDGWGARAVAALICVTSFSLMLFLYNANREAPDALQQASGINPKFIACRDERLAQFTKLRREGAISDSQFDTFTQRAITICASEFPPESQ